MPKLLLTGAGFTHNWGAWLASEAFEFLLSCAEVDEHMRQQLWSDRNRGLAAVCTFTFIRFAMMLGDLHRTMDADMSGNPFRGIADALVNSVSLDWAWAVLLIGVGLLVTSTLWIMRENANEASPRFRLNRRSRYTWKQLPRALYRH